jgi:hypothetical protein
MMKPLLIAFLAFVPASFSCNKIIEKKKENIVMDAITNGRWFVKEYRAASLYVTAEFDGYEFQFYNDGRVDGILNTSVSNGTWTGDVNQMTITSNFGSAGQPLSRLDGTWKITDNSYTDVSAYNVNGADTNFLQLEKK